MHESPLPPVDLGAGRGANWDMNSQGIFQVHDTQVGSPRNKLVPNPIRKQNSVRMLGRQ